MRLVFRNCCEGDLRQGRVPAGESVYRDVPYLWRYYTKDTQAGSRSREGVLNDRV
jgi:hypothetical protein